jgi:hypothetical protein
MSTSSDVASWLSNVQSPTADDNNSSVQTWAASTTETTSPPDITDTDIEYNLYVKIEVKFIQDLLWTNVYAAIRDANDSFPQTVFFRRGKCEITRVVVLGTVDNPVFTVNYKRKGGNVAIQLDGPSQTKYETLREEWDE